jgi:aryl-alcohol dehydrogenase-like predicted oxidoreductase
MNRAELILRYTLSHAHCHTTIVGTCSPAHLTENLVAVAKGLSLVIFASRSVTES